MRGNRIGRLVWPGCASVMALAMCCDTHGDPPPQSAVTALIQRPSVVLGRVGVDVEAIVAAGVGNSLIEGVIQHAAAHIRDHGESLRAAEARAKAARARLKAMENARAEAQVTVADLAAMTEELEAAEEALSVAREQLVCDAMQGCAEEVKSRLDRIRKNRKWGVPTKFLVKDRSDAEWTQLREALRASADAERSVVGREVSAAEVLVATASADVEVVAAQQRLETQTAVAIQTWVAADSAVGGG